VLFIAPHRSLTPLDLKRRLTEAGTISGARRLSISDVVSRLQTNVGIEAADEAIRAETARVVTVGNGGFSMKHTISVASSFVSRTLRSRAPQMDDALWKGATLFMLALVTALLATLAR
jgi:hypothetical protein